MCFIIQAYLFAVVDLTPLQLCWLVVCEGIISFLPTPPFVSYHHNDTENRVNYCMAVGKQRIRITEHNERGRSSKDSLRRLPASPLSILQASSVTMATVNGHLSFSSSYFYFSRNCYLPFHSNWNEGTNKMTLLLPAVFYPTSKSLFTVMLLCLWLFWRCRMLFCSSFLICCLFVWHLASGPQREVHYVAQIKG